MNIYIYIYICLDICIYTYIYIYMSTYASIFFGHGCAGAGIFWILGACVLGSLAHAFCSRCGTRFALHSRSYMHTRHYVAHLLHPFSADIHTHTHADMHTYTHQGVPTYMKTHTYI